MHACPHATAPDAVDALCELRRRHPTWGPKKLLAVLAARRRTPGRPGRPTAAMDAPNAIWTAAFKGECKTRDGVYCYPLAVCDGYSRVLLACRGLPSTGAAGARPVSERLFREHGLPARIRSDNGATIALGRRSAPSVWWLRLGILPDLIEPSSPQQNGAHERMQRTLKPEATRPAAATLAAQQRVFDRFRREFNEERPHEALGQAVPASRYTPSPRAYPARLPPVEYPAHWEVRRVSRNGGVCWYDAWVNVSHVLAEEYVGFEEVDAGVWNVVWNVVFGPLVLGRFDERTLEITDVNGYRGRNPRRV